MASGEGYDIVLCKSIRDQLQVYLSARHACLQANQQYICCALLKMMGYQVNITSDEEVLRPRNVQLTQALREVKRHIRDADYIDWSEQISPEAIAIYDAVRTRNASTDPDTAQRLANQMRMMQASFSAGLNPQEGNQMVDKDLTPLVDAKLLLPQDDPNQLISNYLNHYGELIAFRKRVQRISGTGLVTG